MISIDIPGYRRLELENLILDYNGTLAVDGVPVEGVLGRLERLAAELTIHVVTADTFGGVADRLGGLPLAVAVLPTGSQDVGKLKFLKQLGSRHAVCMGNGRNDALMLKEAALGIAVMLAEGLAADALAAADVVCPGIVPALDLLLHPLRLTATLRC
jgi:soluble P-type ATPase